MLTHVQPLFWYKVSPVRTHCETVMACLLSHRSVMFHGFVEKAQNSSLVSLFTSHYDTPVRVAINTSGIWIIDKQKKVRQPTMQRMKRRCYVSKRLQFRSNNKWTFISAETSSSVHFHCVSAEQCYLTLQLSTQFSRWCCLVTVLLIGLMCFNIVLNSSVSISCSTSCLDWCMTSSIGR